jgi:hypothetical protein
MRKNLGVTSYVHADGPLLIRVNSCLFAVQIFVLSLQICVHLQFFCDRFRHSWLSFCPVTGKKICCAI